MLTAGFCGHRASVHRQQRRCICKVERWRAARALGAPARRLERERRRVLSVLPTCLVSWRTLYSKEHRHGRYSPGDRHLICIVCRISARRETCSQRSMFREMQVVQGHMLTCGAWQVHAASDKSADVHCLELRTSDFVQFVPSKTSAPLDCDKVLWPSMLPLPRAALPPCAPPSHLCPAAFAIVPSA